LSLDSAASVLTTLDRTELESLPPKADAEASIFTKATSTLAEIANVMSFGMRCVVFARKKSLSDPLYMKSKFADSNHTTTYEDSTVCQIQFEPKSSSTIASSVQLYGRLREDVKVKSVRRR